MTEVGNLDTIYSALKALSLLRANVGDVFKQLLDSSQSVNNTSESDDVNGAHIQQFKTFVSNLTNRFR